MHLWHTWDDIIDFACSLHSFDRIGFLIVLSAVTWSIWKHRNELCYNNMQIKSARSLILMIKSLCLYWICVMKKKVKDVVGEWLPVIEYAIPINQFMPLPMVVYQPRGEDTNLESP